MTTATQTQLRRDTASNVNAATPATGELAVDNTNKRLRLGDGATAGGIVLPNFSDIQNSVFNSGTTGGAANVQTITLSPVPAAYVAQMCIHFKAGFTNTGATTLNVNSLGAKNLMKNVSGTVTALAAGDIASGVCYVAIYDGTQFQVKVDVAGGLTSVHQGDLNTSLGSISTISSTSAMLTLPGGLFGFYPQLKRGIAGSSAIFATIVGDGTTTYALGTTYITRIGLKSDGTQTVSAQQQYVNASPPFDLGDGEMAGFIFAVVNKVGEIISTYIADVPPWAYNGPTSLKADFTHPVTGKKFRRVAKRTLDEIIGGAPFEHELQEITQAIKNADMPLIPHPFGDCGEGETIVLLNPRDDKLAAIMEHHGNGGADEVLDALHSGKIYAGNEFLRGMKGPPGVPIAPLVYKYSGR